MQQTSSSSSSTSSSWSWSRLPQSFSKPTSSSAWDEQLAIVRAIVVHLLSSDFLIVSIKSCLTTVVLVVFSPFSPPESLQLVHPNPGHDVLADDHRRHELPRSKHRLLTEQWVGKSSWQIYERPHPSKSEQKRKWNQGDTKRSCSWKAFEQVQISYVACQIRRENQIRWYRKKPDLISFRVVWCERKQQEQEDNISWTSKGKQKLF